MAGERILIVEDEKLAAEQIKQSLTARGYHVVGVTDSGEEAITLAQENTPDLVIMDILLPGAVDGISAAQELQPLDIPVVYLTAHADQHLIDRAQHTRPLAYVRKPASPAELSAVIQLALSKRSQERKIERDKNLQIVSSRGKDEQFRLMVAGVLDYAIFTLDTTGRVNSWNRGAERIIGYSPQQIIGQPHAILFTEEDRQNDIPQKELNQAREAGVADDTRWLVRQNGQRYFAGGTLTAIRDGSGVLAGYAKITRDETERKHMQEALRRSEERLRIALNAARVGTWYWNLRTDADTLDESLRVLFGLEPDQDVSTIEDFYALVHPDDRRRIREAFQQTRSEGVHLDTAFRIPQRDGTDRWFIDQGEVVLDELGKPEYMAGACVDITERKNAEMALRESEERFRFFVDNMRDYAFVQMDANGHVVSWSPGAEAVLGYAPEEMIGQLATAIFVPEDVAAGVPQREMQDAATHGRAIDERWHRRKDGTRFWCSGVITAMKDDEGHLRGFAKVMQDRTAQWKADEQRTASLNEKEVLLKEIHHRVKNNLQVITSLLTLQSDSIEDPKIRKFFEEACNRVRSIGDIHELLYRSPDLAHISSYAYLDRLAQHLLSFYGADPDRIRISISANVDLPLTDAIPCGLILNELLTNSLKHAFRRGEEGNIQVGLKCEEKMCTLEVADDGVGLPAGLVIEENTSLGLKIVSVLARQLRGEVRLERVGGTRVSVVFPLTEGMKVTQIT